MSESTRQNIPSTAPPEDAYVLPFGEFLATLWRRAWLIVLVAVVCSGATIGISLAQQPVYEASIEVWVGQEAGLTETPTAVGGLQDLTATMTTALPSRSLAEEVIRRENLQVDPDTFKDERLTVTQLEETQLIEVSYTDTDPRRAQRVVNTIGEVFSEQVSDLSDNASAVTATVWETAAAPGSPVSPNPIRDGLLAAALGVLLGTGLALLLELLNDRWRSAEELEQVSGVPVFGIIPQFEVEKGIKKDKG